MRRAKPLLGTLVEIGVSAPAIAANEARAINAIELAFLEIEKLQNQLSFHSATSELTRLNCNPGQWVPLAPSTLRVLRLARGLMVRSQHAFNVTCGGTLVLAGKLPNPYQHSKATHFLPIGDAADIALRPNAARLRRPVFITLDGIAKGYAVDKAIAILQRHGLSGGWVNAGGDVKVFGDASLSIFIRTPTGPRFALRLQNHALASSQNINNNDERFPSLLVSSHPKALQHATITVQAKQAWLADALTKVVAFSTATEGARILQRCNAAHMQTHLPLDATCAPTPTLTLPTL